MPKSDITTSIYPCHGGYTGEARASADGGRVYLAPIFRDRDQAQAAVAALRAWIVDGRPPGGPRYPVATPEEPQA